MGEDSRLERVTAVAEERQLYLKGSVDGVQHGTQGEIDFARGAIEIERDLSDRRTGLRELVSRKAEDK